MNDQYVRNVIEAALLAAGRPLAADELVGLFDERDGSAADEVRNAISALQADYETRGIELAEVASGYRIQIRSAVAQPVSRLWQERPTKYSRALLETLRAGGLPAADHAWRDRADSRRDGEPEHHQDDARARLDTRHRTSRRPGSPRAARHHPRVPRLLRPAKARRPADARAAQGARGSARAAVPARRRARRRIDRSGRDRGPRSSGSAATAEATDAAESSDEDELEAAQADEPRPQGLVARPASDDAD